MIRRLLIAITIFKLTVWAPQLEAAQPPPGVKITCTPEPAVASPGTVVDLAIQIEMPAGWITYDLEQVSNSVMPTRITLDRSPDFAPLQGYSAPIAMETRDPVFKNRVVRYFVQPPTFHRPIVVESHLTDGVLEISGRVDFQLLDPATGKYYVIQQSPFRTKIEIRSEGGRTKPAGVQEKIASSAEQNPPMVSTEVLPSIDATQTHKPILEDLDLPEAAPTVIAKAGALPEEPAPLALPVIEDTAPQKPEAPGPKAVTSDAASVPPSIPPATVPVAETEKQVATIGTAPKSARPATTPSNESIIRTTAAITVEVRPGELEIPFHSTFGVTDAPAFHWDSLEDEKRSRPWLSVALGILLGLVAFAIPGVRTDSWFAAGQRLLVLLPIVAGAALALFLPTVSGDLTVATLGFIAAGFLFYRKPVHEKNATALTSLLGYGAMATLVGQFGESGIGAVLGLTGFFLGGAGCLITIGMSASDGLEWIGKRITALDPPGHQQIVLSTLLALGVYLLGHADFADGASDWLGYRSVLGIWTALSALTAAQSLIPFAESIRRLREQPERLVLTLLAIGVTLSLASHLFTASSF